MADTNDKTPYDMLLEDNTKMHQEIDELRGQLQEVLGMNRALLGRTTSGSTSNTNGQSLAELTKKLDGGLRHGS